VDLLGRLSNPPETLETVPGPGVVSSGDGREQPTKQQICSPTASESNVQEIPGRLSNPAPRPVQRRLSAGDIDDICAAYASGTLIDALARSHGVNRTTIISHLDQHGVPRRRVVRKMTDALVAEAAVEYLDGHSLAIVANQFNVAIRTLRREFNKAGIAIRPRQGWTF
jgi:hypothetical protein